MSRLTLATYRALLREARNLERGAATVRLTDLPTVEASVKGYGRGHFATLPQLSRLQSELFPGVSFSGCTSAEMTGRDVSELVKQNFRLGCNADKALHHLAALNTLRAASPCSTTTLTTFGEQVSVLVELNTIFMPTLPSSLLASSERYTWAYRLRVQNVGKESFQILGRHWRFQSKGGELLEVPRGSPGLVGQAPSVEPGRMFEYTSGVSLGSPEGGTMEGSFQAVTGLSYLSFDISCGLTQLKGPPASASR